MYMSSCQVALAREAVVEAAHYPEGAHFAAALDALERAVEARKDAEIARVEAAWRANLAEANARIERLSRLEAAARAVLDDVDLITDLFSTRPAPLSVFDRLRAALKAGEGEANG